MLKRVETDYGDRPQMGNMLQSRNGSFWQGFFTFANKKQSGGAPMTGMVIIYAYAPQSGTSGGATLIDTTTNFTTSANSMVQALINAVQTGSKGGQSAQTAPKPAQSGSPAGAAPAAGAASAGPAQQLTPYAFPDQTGAISLPAGWKPDGARHREALCCYRTTRIPPRCTRMR
jgi:hypothetical protein